MLKIQRNIHSKKTNILTWLAHLSEGRVRQTPLQPHVFCHWLNLQLTQFILTCLYLRTVGLSNNTYPSLRDLFQKQSEKRWDGWDRSTWRIREASLLLGVTAVFSCCWMPCTKLERLRVQGVVRPGLFSGVGALKHSRRELNSPSPFIKMHIQLAAVKYLIENAVKEAAAAHVEENTHRYDRSARTCCRCNPRTRGQTDSAGLTQSHLTTQKKDNSLLNSGNIITLHKHALKHINGTILIILTTKL